MKTYLNVMDAEHPNTCEDVFRSWVISMGSTVDLILYAKENNSNTIYAFHDELMTLGRFAYCAGLIKRDISNRIIDLACDGNYKAIKKMMNNFYNLCSSFN